MLPMFSESLNGVVIKHFPGASFFGPITFLPPPQINYKLSVTVDKVYCITTALYRTELRPMGILKFLLKRVSY